VLFSKSVNIDFHILNKYVLELKANYQF